MDYISLVENCKTPKDLHQLLAQLHIQIQETNTSNVPEFVRAAFYKKSVEGQIRLLESRGVFLNQLEPDCERIELQELRQKIAKILNVIDDVDPHEMPYQLKEILEIIRE